MQRSYPAFFTEPHKLLNIGQDKPLLIALSGGADSSALLHLLARSSKELGFPLYAAHVNHNIRTDSYGDEAARDESFCREICKKLGVELFVESVDVPAMADREKCSIETAARDARYTFFSMVMKQKGINILVTAHNADDNLETQIFNLSRGCGIEGICGIPQIRNFDLVSDGVIVRPILSATKAAIIEFCDQNDIKYVTDSTNAEDDCTRNRIRHRIIPELVELFGSPQKAALRLSEAANCDSDFLNSTAESFLCDVGGILEISELNALHPAISKRVLILAYKGFIDSIGQGASLEHVHISNLAALVSANIPHSAISLPNKTIAKIEGGKLIFETDEPPKEAPKFSVSLHRGMNFIPGDSFALLISENEGEDIFADASGANIYKLYTSAYIKSDKIVMLSARNRREGDVICNGGMNKKVKKLLCDKKIPLHMRGLLPIICGGQEIIYLPMCAVADSAKASKNGPRICISVYKKINRGN